MAKTKKKNRSWLIIGGLLIVLIGLMAGKKFLGEQAGLEVELGTVEVRDVYARVSESGVIQPTIEVPVAPDVSGEVVHLAVREGMKVRMGDLLVTIRPDDYKAQLDQADASLNRARAANMQAKASVSQAQAQVLQDSINLVRTRNLYADSVVSKLELENAELAFNVSRSQLNASRYSMQSAWYQVKSAEATRRQARQNLDRTNIYASMDGTITRLNVELGQRVVGTNLMAGTEILRVADLSSMEVVVEINENDIINVGLGDSARVEVDAFPGDTFYGRVSEIAYSATVTGLASSDQVTNFEVKVNITASSYQKNQQLIKELRVGESPFRPGMTALIEIYTREEMGVLAVPIQAVTLRAVDEEAERSRQVEVVYLYQPAEGTVAKLPVETGLSDDTYIKVVGDLQEGDQVIIGPYSVLTRQLKDGMAVKEMEETVEKKRGGRPSED